VKVTATNICGSELGLPDAESRQRRCSYGYAGMGDLQGGQAQYLRVPHADFKGHHDGHRHASH